MLCTKFQVFRSKTVTGRFRTDGRTNGQTYRGPKQGKPGRNRNSSQGSVLVSKHNRFVKQCLLVYITGLYRVQVSEKYRFLPQRFNFVTFPLLLLQCDPLKNMLLCWTFFTVEICYNISRWATRLHWRKT